MTDMAPSRSDQPQTDEPQVYAVFDTAFVMTVLVGAVGLAVVAVAG